MNIQLAQKVVNQWKSFVEKRKEVRSILITQYKQSYIRVLNSYKEMKKRRFQQYIINNASNLIYKALKINLWKVKHLRQFLNQNQVKRFYILKSQELIFQNIFNLHAKQVNIKTIRLNIQNDCQHKNLIPLLFHKIKSAVILFNFHQLKKTFGETNINRDIIKYEFLYNFIKYVKVKLSKKQFQFTNQELIRHQNLIQKIDQFQSEEYNLLKYIELDNLNILRQIYQYNCQNRNRQLHIFFDFQLREIAAACRIQKYYRAKKNISQMGMKYTAIMQFINQSRAIYVIQRWFRRIRWNHRNNFFKEISFYVSQIPTPNLYLDMQTYSRIQEIVNNQQHSLKFFEQYNMIMADNEIARLQFKSQKFEQQVQSTYAQSLAQFDHLNFSVIPKWLLNEIQMVHINEEKSIDYSIIKQEQKATKWNCRNREYLTKRKESLKEIKFQKQVDIYGLLHFGASISFDFIQNRDYIKFTYFSTSEAKYRAIAFALITYRFKFNGTSILMLSDNLWESTQQKITTFLNRHYQKIQSVFKIEIPTIDNSQLYNGKLNQIILCQNDTLAEKFKHEKQSIQLQFFNENSRVVENFIWMCPQKLIKQPMFKNQYTNNQLIQNNLKNSSHIQQINQSSDNIQQEYYSIIQNHIQQKSIDLTPQSIIMDGSSKSTQMPVKFSIMCLENSGIQFKPPKFKRRTEQSYQEFVMTSRFRTQNNSLNNSKIKEQNEQQNNNIIQVQKKKKLFPLEDINESGEYSQLKQKYQEIIQIENKEKIAKIKQKNQNEMSFIREFQNFTSLLQRQEQKIMNHQLKTARIKSVEKSYKGSIQQTMKSQSVTRREDYQDVSIVFPKIEPKSSKKQTINSRLSNYHRYAVFPEELYAISKNQETLKC